MAKSPARGATKSKYSPHPMLQKEDDDKERLRNATGKTFDAWVALARAKGPAAQRACRELLDRSDLANQLFGDFLVRKPLDLAHQ